MDPFKNKFNSDGYVLIKDFFNDEEANNIIQYANDLEQWDETPFKWMIYFEKKKIHKQNLRHE